MLSYSVHNFKMIGKRKRMLWTNDISRDFSLRWVSTDILSLLWRHNDRVVVSNHQPHDCLLTVYSGADQRKHQSSASLAFVRGIHQWPLNSPHLIPVDDVIMIAQHPRSTWIIFDQWKCIQLYQQLQSNSKWNMKAPHYLPFVRRRHR